jgi:hypothetical protein
MKPFHYNQDPLYDAAVSILQGQSSPQEQTITEEKTEKEKALEKFAKDYQKLMQKYPDIMVGGDINGDPIAYILDVRQTKQIKL